MGLLEPYTPKGADQIKPAFRSGKNPLTWTGMDAWLAVMCYNTVEGGKKNLPRPASWADLANPVYKDSIVMPNPASSGTGYQAVYAWIQIMGEKAAWEFMDKLHQNIAVYTHSGSAPCVQAAKGERVIGIGFDMRGAKEKTGGAPIDIILAKEGAPWDMEATAIVKGTKNLAAAQKLADFAVSKGAYELYGKYYAIVGYPGMNPAPPNYPPSADAAMVKIDLAKMGAGAREDPRRVDQALRRQVGAEVTSGPATEAQRDAALASARRRGAGRFRCHDRNQRHDGRRPVPAHRAADASSSARSPR